MKNEKFTPSPFSGRRRGGVAWKVFLFELHGQYGAGVVAGDLDADVGHGAPVGGGGELVPALGDGVAVVWFVGAAGGESDGLWRGCGGEEVGLDACGFGFAVVVFRGGECGGFEGGGVGVLLEAVEVGF